MPPFNSPRPLFTLKPFFTSNASRNRALVLRDFQRDNYGCESCEAHEPIS